MPMVEAKFRLLQVPVERLPGDSVEFGQSAFGETPERFDAVDVIRTPGEFILTVMDPKMFIESHVDQAIIPSPSVRVNQALRIGFATDHRLENRLARIGDDFRVHPIAALQKPEDDRFSTGATASLSPDPVGTEIGLVIFQGSDQGRLPFASLGKPLPDPKEDLIDGADRKPGEG